MRINYHHINFSGRGIIQRLNSNFLNGRDLANDFATKSSDPFSVESKKDWIIDAKFTRFSILKNQGRRCDRIDS